MVVLALLVMVMVLLMQGLFFMLQIRERVHANLLAAGPAMHRDALLRAMLSGLTADSMGGEDRLLGRPSRLHGLTFASLLLPQGVPVAVDLWIEQEEQQCRLNYQEAGQQPLVLGVWAGTECGFAYLSDQGGFQEEWSSRATQELQMPRGVLFTVVGKQKEEVFTLFAAIQGRRLGRPVPDIFDEEM